MWWGEEVTVAVYVYAAHLSIIHTEAQTHCTFTAYNIFYMMNFLLCPYKEVLFSEAGSGIWSKVLGVAILISGPCI